MGFTVHNQQRIALSHLALTILENDCLLFRCVDKHSGEPSRYKFINRIFCNYYDRADASIEMRLAEKKETYQGLKPSKCSKDSENFVNRILEKEKEELTQKMEARLSADYTTTSNVISLNNETISIWKHPKKMPFTEKEPLNTSVPSWKNMLPLTL